MDCFARQAKVEEALTRRLVFWDSYEVRVQGTGRTQRRFRFKDMTMALSFMPSANRMLLWVNDDKPLVHELSSKTASALADEAWRVARLLEGMRNATWIEPKHPLEEFVDDFLG